MIPDFPTPVPAPRSADEIAREGTEALLPPGTALKGENIRTLMRALAAPREALERDSAAIMCEICPGTSDLMLDDYRIVLGSDPLGRDQGDLSEHEWRFVLHQRWTARGDQKPVFYIALAQSYGITISITEPKPPICKTFICGDGSEVGKISLRFTWVVELPDGTLKAVCGPAVCGTLEAAQGEISGFAELIRVFRLLRPAHSDVYFKHDGVWVND